MGEEIVYLGDESSRLSSQRFRVIAERRLGMEYAGYSGVLGSFEQDAYVLGDERVEFQVNWDKGKQGVVVTTTKGSDITDKLKEQLLPYQTN